MYWLKVFVVTIILAIAITFLMVPRMLSTTPNEGELVTEGESTGPNTNVYVTVFFLAFIAEWIVIIFFSVIAKTRFLR